jgi:hypothetical protein
MNYTLLNKRLNRRLTHPAVGLWFTPRLDEAQDMLKACHEYLHACNLGHLAEDFVIVDVETGEEILL